MRQRVKEDANSFLERKRVQSDTAPVVHARLRLLPLLLETLREGWPACNLAWRHRPDRSARVWSIGTRVVDRHACGRSVRVETIATGGDDCRCFPAVIELLASGQLNLTAVRLVAPHLTRQNHAELFAKAANRNKRQVQELLAHCFPRPDVRPSVRRLPVVGCDARTAVRSDACAADGAGSSAAGSSVGAAGVDRVLPTPRSGSYPPDTSSRPLIAPLRPDRYRVTFTASGAARDKLEVARDLLRHRMPDGDLGLIVERALDALIDDLLRRRFAVTDRARSGVPSRAESRHVPAEVRRTVYVRDGGRCAFLGASGRRCDERAFIEFHHVRPFAAGGEATVGNISLRCRAHNGQEVERFFGVGKRFLGSEAREG